jgi:hypothetical protein
VYGIKKRITASGDTSGRSIANLIAIEIMPYAIEPSDDLAAAVQQVCTNGPEDGMLLKASRSR